jgi:hypothetical protein
MQKAKAQTQCLSRCYRQWFSIVLTDIQSFLSFSGLKWRKFHCLGTTKFGCWIEKILKKYIASSKDQFLWSYKRDTIKSMKKDYRKNIILKKEKRLYSGLKSLTPLLYFWSLSIFHSPREYKLLPFLHPMDAHVLLIVQIITISHTFRWIYVEFQLLYGVLFVITLFSIENELSCELMLHIKRKFVWFNSM